MEEVEGKVDRAEAGRVRGDQDEEEEEALSLMKLEVQTLGSSAEGEKRSNLMRFLAARNMDGAKAAKMYVKWKNWRLEMVPLGYIPEEEIVEQLEARKVFLQGLSKAGHPLIVALARNHFPATSDHNQLKKFIVHLLDKAIASCPKEKESGNTGLCSIVDLKDLSFKNIDIAAFITGFQFSQDYYPQRLGKVYVVSMPLFFRGIWKVIKPFLDDRTLKKVEIVTSEEQEKAMVEELGEHVVPTEYGGSAQLIPLQDAKITMEI